MCANYVAMVMLHGQLVILMLHAGTQDEQESESAEHIYKYQSLCFFLITFLLCYSKKVKQQKTRKKTKSKTQK